MDITKEKREIPYSLVFVFLALSFLVIFAGYAYYSSYKKTLINNIKKELISICGLKVNQLVQWRKERLGDAKYILNNILIADEINDFLKNPGHQADKKKILSWLTQTRDSYDYKEVAVFDFNGKVIFSTEKDIYQDEDHMRLAINSLEKKEVVFGDFHKHQITGEIDLGLFIPVFISRGTGKYAIGGIMLLIDPEKFLYPLIQTWPVPSETAETLLVRQDGNNVLYLNELRHKKNNALSLRIPIANESLPAAMAVRGREGIVEGKDYRNILVMAALKKVPDTGWYFIAKMDLKEAYLPVERIVPAIAVFVIVGILAAGLGLGLFWRNQIAVYYRGLYKAKEALRESEEIFQSFMEHSPIYVFFKDENIRSLRLSRNFETMLSRPLAELLGKSMDELFPSELAKSMVEDDKRIMSEGKTLNIEEELNGRFYHTIKFPINIEGKPRYLAGYTIDITERKQAEDNLRSLIERNEAILAAVPDIIMEVDAQKVYTWANKAGHDFFGEDVIGKEAAYYFEGEQETYRNVQPLFNGDENIIYVESWQRRKDGEKRLLAWWCRVLKDSSGNVTGALSTARDITENMKAEEALKLNEDRLETLLKLNMMKVSSEKEITDFALEEGVRLTRSDGGYLHFFNEDEQTIQLYSWSKGVLQTCTAAKDEHYPLDAAGVWADSVRLRIAVIHNDYQTLASKKGYPEGHFHLVRHLGVPIIDGDRIVGVTGVGNKKELYNETDVRQLTLLMNSMWGILKQKRMDIEREKLIKELQEALANIRTLSGMLPICATCKKIRDDKGYWNRIETYISEHSEVLFSHGICPDCAKKAYEELEKLKKDRNL